MDTRGLAAAVQAVAARAGVPDAAPRLTRFLELLAAANENVNLVSRRAGVEELAGHLADSLAALPFLPKGRPVRLLDIGSGGGFPAIVMLLIRNDLYAVMVESVGKKAVFLRDVCRSLELTAEVANVRFPDPSLKRMPRFDLLTSRAVADPLGLVAAARPFLKPDARALLFTTRRVLSESRLRLPYRFEPIAGTEQKGIAIVEAAECFT